MATPIVIDTHTHWFPPAYVDVLRHEAERSPEFAREHGRTIRAVSAPGTPGTRLDVQIEEMAGAGVDTALVSLPPPATTFGDADTAARVAVSANDTLIEAAAEFGMRVRVLASLPLPHLEASLRELDRVASLDEVVGVQVLSTGKRSEATPDRFEVVLAEAASRGLPVVLHPAIEPLPAAFADWELMATVGAPMSSTVGALRLVFAGVLDRVPQLSLVVPHLGGALPYLLQRIADFGNGEAQHGIEHYLGSRMYFDTCSYHPPAMRCAVDTVGSGRLVLGSDYPFRGPARRAVDDVRDFFAGDVAATAAVLGGNAQALFSLGRQLSSIT